MPKDLRRSLKIRQIIKENDASTLAKTINESFLADLYGVDALVIRKWMMRAQKRLNQERNLDFHSKFPPIFDF